ncbi:SPARC-related modular calcium-binding protein 2 isoform X3 [Anabrus simplex]|uniref:SPARC-related modular calcium-binding protein 2 isoform X3 n=1 Tax=Anabrus simplex TaxID=316456 RepID=UPI0035A26B1B
MIIFILLAALASTSVASTDLQEDDGCLRRVEMCNNAQRVQRRLVCGSNNLTYLNKCHLLREQCQGVQVTLKHQGSCKDTQKCPTDRHYAERIPRPPQVELFIPTCLEDGSYAPVQCHTETGYCWCVTPMGKPIPNTSVRHDRPNCGRRACGRNERSSFINNLIHNFKAEYNRRPGSAASQILEEEDGDLLERAVLDWKFTEMDRDNDTFLSKPEYSELRRLVRKVVRPRRCAKMFPRMCDRDTDKRISREEWSACLGLNFNLSFSLFRLLNSDGRRTDGPTTPSKDEGEWTKKRLLTSRALLRNTLSQLRASTQILRGSMPSQPGLGDDTPDKMDEPEANDCLSDQKTALEEQRSGTSGLYIPECTPDGRYKKIQCYNSTGYCWCVYEDTGVPIPGTSIKDQNPNCDVVPPLARPMNGCPEPRKQMFLREFMEFMKKKMLATAKNKNHSESGTPPSGGPDENVATWAFHLLDKNKNKIWERKEWKSLRSLVMTQQQLRRCGKRLPRYCDVNQDQKISLTEWLNCLSTQRVNATVVTPNPTASSNRTGSNPLEMYLKPE